MIQSITITNFKGESLVIPLTNPQSVGLYIESIDGLGPPSATINTYELATGDGGIYSSARCDNRNIVLTIGMLDNPIVEDMRHLLYTYFPIKKQVSITVTTDRREVTATGYTESHEPNIFSERETAQISVVCPDPFMYSLETTESIFSGVRPMFTFPFSNESLIEDLLIMGEIVEDKRVIIEYEGDVDTGVLITVHAGDTYSGLVLHNEDTAETFKIDESAIKTVTGISIAAGDDVIINTYPGQKSYQLLHSGKYYNIIGAMDKSSSWFKLTAGTNNFVYTADTGEDDIEVVFAYKNAYGGI